MLVSAVTSLLLSRRLYLPESSRICVLCLANGEFHYRIGAVQQLFTWNSICCASVTVLDVAIIFSPLNESQFCGEVFKVEFLPFTGNEYYSNVWMPVGVNDTTEFAKYCSKSDATHLRNNESR